VTQASAKLFVNESQINTGIKSSLAKLMELGILNIYLFRRSLTLTFM
jgi:hypothetical protein